MDTRRLPLRVQVLTLATLLLLAGAVAGCGTFLRSHVSTFHRLPPSGAGKTFIVMPRDKNKVGSLEFDSNAKLVAAHLSVHGYRHVGNLVEADYVVLMDYWIDSGQTTSEVLPLIGQTGGGYTYHSFGGYSGYSYTPPSYGIIGAIPFTATEYTRHLVLDFVDGKKLAAGSVEKTYEARVISRGSSSSLSQVVPYMIKAIFQDFPGRSGETRSVTVHMD